MQPSAVLLLLAAAESEQGAFGTLGKSALELGLAVHIGIPVAWPSQSVLFRLVQRTAAFDSQRTVFVYDATPWPSLQTPDVAVVAVVHLVA